MQFDPMVQALMGQTSLPSEDNIEHNVPMDFPKKGMNEHGVMDLDMLSWLDPHGNVTSGQLDMPMWRMPFSNLRGQDSPSAQEMAKALLGEPI